MPLACGIAKCEKNILKIIFNVLTQPEENQQTELNWKWMFNVQQEKPQKNKQEVIEETRVQIEKNWKAGRSIWMIEY